MASSFAIARAICNAFDGDQRMKDTRIEFISDSAEETMMGVPYYVYWCDVNGPGRHPFDLGIVYEGAWMIVAEKGVERPSFSVEPIRTDQASHTMYLDSFTTPPDTSVNTVPDFAEAVVKGASSDLEAFFAQLPGGYENSGWENALASSQGVRYKPIKLQFTRQTDEDGQLTGVKLKALNRGPQHGSQIALNEGNPIACLAYYLDGLVAEKALGVTPIGALAHFIRWEWSTNVCGEDHERLFCEDDMFGRGIRNGTTYALTNLVEEDGKINLKFDIRYAANHHIVDWVPGDSESLLNFDNNRLGGIFECETADFMKENPGYPRVYLEGTATKYAPDIRNPDTNQSCILLKKAFHEGVIEHEVAEWAGDYPKEIPTGGSTDEKGSLCMVAIGLFGLDSGHPVNFHGIDEACLVSDIRLVTALIYKAMAMAIENPPTTLPSATSLQNNSQSLKRMLDFLAKDSDIGCNC